MTSALLSFSQQTRQKHNRPTSNIFIAWTWHKKQYPCCRDVFYPLKYIALLLASLLLLYWLVPQAHARSIDRHFSEFADSERKARDFFLQSTLDAIERLENTSDDSLPIQVDLYIVVHFLMYNNTLAFTADASLANTINRRITGYFEQQLASGLALEGCLAAKLLIGLSRHNTYQDLEKKLAAYYLDFAHKQWHGKGVGECFVTSINRTYGNNHDDFYCTPVATQELAAKNIYYWTVSAIELPVYRKMGLEHINEQPYNKIGSWWHANVEAWVIETFQLPEQSVISSERYRHAVQLVENAILEKEHDTLTLALLSQAYLWSHSKPSMPVIDALRKIAASQDKRGAIPSSIAPPDKPGHNVDATPTYMYLLALDALKKRNQPAL